MNTTYQYTRYHSLTYSDILEEVYLAKERHRRNEEIIPSLDPRRSLTEQLSVNLQIIQAQKNNPAIMQYAIMGEYAINQGIEVTPDLWPSELEIMKFVARLFEGEYQAILYLRHVTPRMLRTLNKGKRKAMLKAQKRKLEFHEANPDNTGHTNKKRRLTEKEETQ